DALNRLTSASGGFGGGGAHVSQSYHYDAIGNLVEKAGVLYTYGDPLHPSAVTSRTDGLAYTYDANGNMVTGGGRALVWDPDDRRHVLLPHRPPRRGQRRHRRIGRAGAARRVRSVGPGVARRGRRRPHPPFHGQGARSRDRALLLRRPVSRCRAGPVRERRPV